MARFPTRCGERLTCQPPSRRGGPRRAGSALGDDHAAALGGLPAISELDAQRYEVQAGSELADTYDQVLKHGESFAVFDRHGDIRPEGLGEEGIYHRGTRHLSGLVLRLAGHRPLLLGSTAKRDNSRLAFDLTNTDLGRGAAAAAAQQRAPVAHQGAVRMASATSGSWCAASRREPVQPRS